MKWIKSSAGNLINAFCKYTFDNIIIEEGRSNYIVYIDGVLWKTFKTISEAKNASRKYKNS